MENQVSPSKIGVRYGLIVSVFLILYGLVLQLLNLAGNQLLGLVSFIILGVFIYLAHNAFKNQGDGFMRFGQGVKIGFLVSLVGGIISSIFTYVYLAFVDDSLIKQAIDKAYKDMESQGMSDEEIETAMGFSEPFMSPVFFTIMGFILTIVVGLVISLIISAVTKKDNSQVA